MELKKETKTSQTQRTPEQIAARNEMFREVEKIRKSVNATLAECDRKMKRNASIGWIIESVLYSIIVICLFIVFLSIL